ncbi:MAG: RHS repeat-associated core domain-containing protein [Pseudomonadota bacterium]
MENKVNNELGWKFEYDDSDRVTKVIDPAGLSTKIRYILDKAKRLRKFVQTTAEGSTVIHEFDERGRRSSMRDEVGTVTYGYDDLSRLIRVHRRGVPTITYSHDTLDRIKSLQVGDFYRIEYYYDFLGRLESMKTPVGVIRYDYLTEQGKVIRTLPNGVKTISDYEPNGELRKITHGLSSSPNDNSYRILAEYRYQYRPDGLIEAIQERSAARKFVRTYEYDTVGRLVGATGPQGRQHAYEYDLVGNRIKALSSVRPPQSLSYDWVGRVTSIDGTLGEYDVAGNLTSANIGRTSLRYRYNQDNRLAEALNGKVTYRYDGEGQLIARKTGGIETTFIPDPLSANWQPLVMKEESGHRTLLVWDGATPLIMIRDGKAEYLLHDHLGSVRLVVDDQGNVTQRLDYDPFGSMTDSAMTEDFAPRFAGLFWDSVGSVYLTRARAYSPRIGRFLQVDPQLRIPFGSQKDLSVYAYCGDDPVNFVDLDGAAPLNVNTRDVWWDAFWKDLRGHLFDARRGKDVLADYSDAHMRNARGSGIAAGLTATALDIIGGYIPGEGGNRGQAYASVGWSLAMGGFSSGGGVATALKTVGYTRTTSSAIVNSAQGNYSAALLDTGSLGGAALSAGAIDVFGYYSSAYDTYKAASIGGGSTNQVFSYVTGARDAVIGSFTFSMGQFLNFVGKDSNWIGANRGGGEFSGLWQKDSLGRFPLGNTEVGTKGKHLPWDEAAKWHDTQDYVNWHADKGTEVKVPWGNGQFKYFTSRGKESSTHDREVVQFASGKRLDYPITDSPRTSHPVDLSVLRQKYPVSDRRSNMSPTTVGGVYLGGAGQTLEAVGVIEGISIDSNNNLILLSQTGEKIDLPPLRIDDVVTVFRSVYIHGEGPTVTIDPNPKNPEGSAMIIRHGKATENTYVGWVLYQADRLMKGYTLGVDNESTEEVSSVVPGYTKVLNTIYFGGESPQKLRKKGHWERFWIVPAEARRFGAGKKTRLTLFDVPLKVKTQSMKWKNGKLVDDLRGRSSPGALAFTDWFTRNYNHIAEERFLTPPPESGIIDPVPVFTELRRIALITAIAEKLRDQGIQLPFWMRDYEIQAVPFEKFTPGLEVTRSKQRVAARVYGGVQLSPEDKDVRDFTPDSKLAKLSKDERQSVRKKIKLAGVLDEVVQGEMISVAPLKVRQFSHQGTGYQAVALPGGDTQALAPARLREVDLSVTVEGGRYIELVRHYNSFFNPNGSWGKGWTQDLPRLDQTKVPVRREGSKVSYRTAFELITPLNSINARFARIEKVPTLNNSRLQVPDKPSEFFGLADGQPDFLSGSTLKLIRKDGGAWHFSKAGSLVAIEKDGFRTVYERNADGRLTRIVGLLGKRPVAFIELKYESSGRLKSAKANKADHESTETVVRYEYDSAGRLSGIVSQSGRFGYRYQGPWVTDVTYLAGDPEGKSIKEVALRSFEYNPRGQLLSEIAADGTKTTYKVRSDTKGSTVTVMQSGKESVTNTIRYGLAFKPIEAKYADGTQASWRYPGNGDSVLDLKDSEGNTIRLTESADQRQRTLQLDEKHQITSEFDTAGRMTSLSENGRTLIEQKWSPNGQLQVAKNETLAEHFEYDADGLVSRVVQTPPGESGQFKRWQETKVDPTGRPIEIKDYRGMHLSIAYDDDGEFEGVVIRLGAKKYGFKVIRDKFGRVQEIKSSWGDQRYDYDAKGRLTKVEVDRGGATTAWARWKSDYLHKIKQFDGGDLSLIYYKNRDLSGLLKLITAPNRLVLSYQYDVTNRLSKINVGNAYRLALDYDFEGRLTSWYYRPVDG